jgi:hypothetical protein
MVKENKKNSDPASQSHLGYQTYFNNFITQTFLKIRTVLMTAVISFFITLFIELLFNKSLWKMITGWIDFFKLEGLNAFTYDGFIFITKLLEKSIVIIIQAAASGVIFFLISFVSIFIFLILKSRKVYAKKTIRGTEVIDVKELVKKLNRDHRKY